MCQSSFERAGISFSVDLVSVLVDSVSPLVSDHIPSSCIFDIGYIYAFSLFVFRSCIMFRYCIMNKLVLPMV